MKRLSEPQMTNLTRIFRSVIEGIPPCRRGLGMQEFPRAACGATSEVVARLLADITGREARYVYGRSENVRSHAWVMFDGFIVDLTHDQFTGTGLHGWTFRSTQWHSGFDIEADHPVLERRQMGEFPDTVYDALNKSVPDYVRML